VPQIDTEPRWIVQFHIFYPYGLGLNCLNYHCGMLPLQIETRGITEHLYCKALNNLMSIWCTVSFPLLNEIKILLFLLFFLNLSIHAFIHSFTTSSKRQSSAGSNPKFVSVYSIWPISKNWFAGVSIMWPPALIILWCLWGQSKKYNNIKKLVTNIKLKYDNVN
jgi:hypothetical protein